MYIRVIKNRMDAMETCDIDLINDDARWMEEVIEMVKCIHVWRQGVEYNTPFKYRAFIVSNEDAMEKLKHDMHCKIINKHLRLNKSIHIFSEIWINTTR